MRVKELFSFIYQRYDIHVKRVQGFPKPWTQDPILQSYRFCNVQREEDTQTKWFAKNWRIPHAKDENMWFAALVFRLTNWSETAKELGYPVPWDYQHFLFTLQDRKRRKEQVFSGAYMISTHGQKVEKAQFLADSLDATWGERRIYQYKQGETLDTFHKRLAGAFGIGSFMAGQVVADMKYCGNAYHAPDWWTFAASGPGSRRGLARVLGFKTDYHWREPEWRATLETLKLGIDPLIRQAKMPKLHAQDLQNCLCEFDKYERVRLGEGRPKQKYNGAK